MCRPDSCGLPGSHAYYAIFQMAGRAGTMSGFDIYAAWNLSACAGGRNLLDFIFFGNESNGRSVDYGIRSGEMRWRNRSGNCIGI